MKYVVCALVLMVSVASSSAGTATAKVSIRPIKLSAETNLAQGSSIRIPVPEPLDVVQQIDGTRGSAAKRGVTVVAADRTITIDASATGATGRAIAVIQGTGCTATTCEQKFILELSVKVHASAAPANVPLEVSDPSADRIAAGVPIEEGGVTLPDELWLTTGTPGQPGSRSAADQLAQSVGAIVTGGIEELGVYQFRWPLGHDLAPITAELEGKPGVTAVSPARIGLLTKARVPNEWDGQSALVTWPFTLIRAPQAWDTTTGGSVAVGILDEGLVWNGHPEMQTVSYAMYAPLSLHATHVAGLACAQANGLGITGASWGCPIISASWGAPSSVLKVLESAKLIVQTGARVVNLSIGYEPVERCGLPGAEIGMHTKIGPDVSMFRALFAAWDVVWTIAAMNGCHRAPASPWAAAAASFDNVLTVASVNSDGSLSSFSNFGPDVKVAAPGGWAVAPDGDGSTGVLSTLYFTCGWSLCPSYRDASGTSMAAPIVAGIAALARSAHGTFSADRIGRCIVQSAGAGTGLVFRRANSPLLPGYRPPTIPFDRVGTGIVDAEAATECTIDQSSTGPARVADYASARLTYPPDHAAPFAQTFAAGRSGRLSRVRLALTREVSTPNTPCADDPTGSLEVSITTTSPSGAHNDGQMAPNEGHVLATRTLPPAAIDKLTHTSLWQDGAPPLRPVSVTFPVSPHVTAGESYAIIVQPTDLPTLNCYDWHMTKDNYARGAAFSRVERFAPPWLVIRFLNDHGLVPADFWFQTYVS